MTSPAHSNEMAPPRPLTLIVATSRNLGIGLRNDLPWPRLKGEMAYFARVTQRLSPSSPPTARNVVVMGRKTWDSIPPKFRPLKGRLNVVVSGSGNVSGVEGDKVGSEEVIVDSTLEAALGKVDALSEDKVARIFVIGGSRVYATALGLERTKRVLLTRVEGDWECDTFFPTQLDGESGAKEGWASRSLDDLRQWTGESLPDEGRESQGDTKWQYELYERP